MTATLVEMALELAASGLPVFPCGKNKRPAIGGGNGFDDAVLAPEAVRALFARAPHAANIGVPTGGASGLTVLDVDYRNGGGVWETEHLADLPDTRMHKTPGLPKKPGDPVMPGRHYVFRHAPGVRNSASKLGLGIDIRGEGGYVCFPPAGGYEVINGSEPVEMPDWLLLRLRALEAKPAPPPEPEGVGELRPVGDKGHRAFIDGEVGKLRNAPDGAKHSALYGAACTLAGHAVEMGIGKGDARGMLIAALHGRNVDSWENAEKTIEDGWKWGLDNPLPPLPDRPGYRRNPNGKANGADHSAEALKPAHAPDPPEVDEVLAAAFGPAEARAPEPGLPQAGTPEAEAEWIMSPDEAAAEQKAEIQRRVEDSAPQPLGFFNDSHFYIGRDTGRLIILLPHQHRMRELVNLAGLDPYWVHTRFKNKDGSVDWDEAAAGLMARSKRRGWFDPDRVRGRGAWIDRSRVVINLGSHLLVDGQPAPLTLPASRFTYPSGLRLSIGLQNATALSNAEASQLIEICNGARWEKPASGQLLAGWIVCALVCGALRWRPHIWLTGAYGSGKSWVMDQVLAFLLRPMALEALSKSTEAGLRQTLGVDALPVVFDEFEQDEKDTGRIQAVLDLIRQASSESGGRIIKGTVHHLARSFRTRSTFCLSSINTSLTHMADESRFTVLSMLPPVAGSVASEAAFDKIEAKRVALFTEDYPARLLARVVNLLPHIIANSATFARIIAKQFGTRRTGDQIGALLAGLYALKETGTIDQATAEAFVATMDWSEAAEAAEERDEVRLLQYLLAHRFSMTPYGRPATNRTIGELIGEAFKVPDINEVPLVSREEAKKELANHGIRTGVRDPDGPGDPGGLGIYVSTNHPALARILKDKPAWNTAWGRALKRLPGAKSDKGQRFGSHPSKAIWLPLTSTGIELP